MGIGQADDPPHGDGEGGETRPEVAAAAEAAAAGVGASTGISTCLACGLIFMSRAEQSAHFKSDRHRDSLRRRIEGREAGDAAPRSAAEFDGDGDFSEDDEDVDDEEDDGDDKDGEDEDEEEDEEEDDASDDMERGWWLRNGHPCSVCVTGSGGGESGGGRWAAELPVALLAESRKALRPHGEGGARTLADGLRRLGEGGGSGQAEAAWAVILVRSGRFAGGIFQGQALVMHKVFKR